MKTAENPRDIYELRLATRGCAVAPNGCTYRMSTTQDDRPEVVRDMPTGTGTAIRERIVGFNGAMFPSMDAARLWAVTDGCADLTTETRFRPLSERAAIA